MFYNIFFKRFMNWEVSLILGSHTGAVRDIVQNDEYDKKINICNES